MELRHLRYFLAVAEELHFGRAAARLHISQPPLSQQIRQLEEELGVVLFHRTKRRVELSDAGRLFLGEARAVLDQARQAKRSVQEAGKGVRGRLSIGFVSSACHTVLPQAVREFRRAYPEVEVSLREMIPAAQLAALARREIDIGLLRPPVTDAELSVESVLAEPLVVALPADHRLAGRRAVPIKALAKEPFVLFPRQHGPGVHDAVLQICHEAGFAPRAAYEPNEMQTILAYVAAGLGVSIVPGSLMSFRRGPIAFRRLAGAQASIELALAWTRARPSVLVDNFRRICGSAGIRCRQEMQNRIATRER